MGSLYIGIAIAALIAILAALFISREKGKQPRKPTNLGFVAMTLVVLGIIFGNTDRILGYSFIGVGVLISIIDAIRNLRNK